MAEARLGISFGFDFSDMVRQFREAADRLEALQHGEPVPSTDDDSGGPANPGVPRCTATWKTEHHGTARCWRAATHTEQDGYELHVGEAETGFRWQWTGSEPGATPHRTAPATEADEAAPVTEVTEGTVCHVYVPPTGNPEDSGFCARCGMYDWRHTGPAPDDIAAWLRDPANHAAVATVLRTEARHDPAWWEQELRRLARVYGGLDRFVSGR